MLIITQCNINYNIDTISRRTIGINWDMEIERVNVSKYVLINQCIRQEKFLKLLYSALAKFK